MTNTYPGNELTITGVIKTLAGVAYDPDTVIFNATDPQGADYTYIYGVDAQITKSSAGTYVVKLLIPFTNAIVGHWTCGLQGKNSLGQSTSFQSVVFKVEQSNAI